jgi:beta-lactamase regulating signal transducer with metallopeptidase domain
MTSNVLTQLGQVLLQSLWQGAVLGGVLLVLLVFIRQSKIRYALACMTLFALLGWVVVSWVQVWGSSLARADSSPVISEQMQSSVATSAKVADGRIVERTNQNALGSSQPTTQENRESTVTASETRTRVTSFNVDLQKVLPYISLAWMVGVAALSLRLLISFYLLRKYRKQSFELSEPWIVERMQGLAKRLKMQQHIALFQTNTLAVPAVMGVLKPLVLLPSSLVSGLSVGQLELLLAHELAHIKRRDYLVNILQTLAETLLFYHPVVWWVSKVIRQEREHCCDDLALQVTGQSAVEYADVLLRLEKSRQTLALAANSGSLLKRVERLLSPTRAMVELRSGIVTLLMVGLLSLTFALNVVRAQVIQVSQVPFVMNVDIAADPTNPNRLAVTLNKASKFNCSLYSCSYDALLYTSTDGGKTWQEQSVYSGLANALDWKAMFNNQGTLYTVGSASDLSDLNIILLDRADAQMKMTREGRFRLRNVANAPSLAMDKETGKLYLTTLEYQENTLEYQGENVFFPTRVPQVQTSEDGGETWTQPVQITREKLSEITGGYVFQANTLIGKDGNLAVVWIQDDNEIIVEEYSDGNLILSSEGTEPNSIWVVSSMDDGKTFSAPKKIGTSWGFSYAAFSDNLYNLYHVTFTSASDDKQGLMTLRSKDNGLSWLSSNVSNSLPIQMGLPLDALPRLDISPNGIVDVVFYSPINACDVEPFPSSIYTYSYDWTDPCSYNVYYTYSSDGGNTFSPLKQLNEEPIVGSRFLRIARQTKPGYIGIASTNDAAYPVWIGNHEGVEGTQAYMMKIER